MGRFGTLIVTSPTGAESRFGLDASRVTVGRGAENDVVVLDIKVSRRHAVLECSATEMKLVDVGSSNGFKFNGHRVREAVLKATDEVLLGATRLRVESADMIQDERTMATVMEAGFEVSVTDHSTPSLVVTVGGKSRGIRLVKPRFLIGRSSSCDLVVDHARVSRQHVEITVSGTTTTLKDLGSRNGTLVNGQPVQVVELLNGDTFEVGDARVVYKAPFSADELSVVVPLPTRSGMRTAPHAAEPTHGSAVSQVQASQARPGRVARGMEGLETAEQVRPAELPPPPARTPMKPVKARPAGRLPVIVVPGFMGSTLYRGDTLVWPAAKTFLKNPEFLKMPENDDLTPRGLVEEVVVVPGIIKLDAYNRLVEYLKEGLGYVEGKDLFVCAYDWRRDLRHGATELGRHIAEWEELPEKVPGKFIIIAHSAGGLCARYYVEKMGGRYHVERLILLGVPHRGTAKPLTTLLGGGSMLPFGANKKAMKETMGTFLAAYQLLPTYPVVYDERGPVDLLNDDTWVPEKAKLAITDARNFFEELGTTSRVPVVSIFGYGQKTLARVDVKRNADGELVDPKFHDEECGDGTVAQDSAILPGSEIHPVQQLHGALYTDNDVKMRLKLELLGRA